MRHLLFWLGGTDSSPKKEIDCRRDFVTAPVVNSDFFTPASQKAAGEIYDIIRHHPDSKQCESICSDKQLFQALKSIHWITAAKEQPSLFKKILAQPSLAQWVNQFPNHDPQGLVMIATYSKEHLSLVSTFLAREESALSLFSSDQVRQINNAIAVERLGTEQPRI